MKRKDPNWKSRVKSCYDREAKGWVIDTEKEPNRYYHGHYFKMIREMAPKNGLALDIGCGGGTYTYEMSKLGFTKVYALDISERMLACVREECKRREIKNVETVKGDVEAMPFKDNYFDMIVLVGVMECLPDKRKALREILRILKPRGRVIIRWLNREGIWGLFESIRLMCRISHNPLGYNSLSNLKDSLKELKVTGFKIRSVQGKVLMPFFLFPSPLSWFFETIFIRIGLAERLEGNRKRREKSIRRWYYSYCIALEK